MSQKKHQSRTDVRRLQEKLDIAYRQLYELENSRTLRGYHHLRRSVKNPVWGVKNLVQIPGLLKKIDFPEAFGEATSYRPSLQGEEKGSFMPYPNLKIASVGTVPDLSTYCHHLVTEGSEWQRLFDRGIDALLLGELDGYVPEKYAETIKKFADAGVPIFILYPHTRVKGVKAKQIKEFIAVDLGAYNPVSLPIDQSTKPVGGYGDNKEVLYKYSAVRMHRNNFKHEYQFVIGVLNSLSCGIPVLTKKSKLLSGYLPASYPYTESSATEDKFLHNLKVDEFAWRRFSATYRRHVHLSHSPRKMVDEIAGLVGFKVEDENPTVSIILSTRRPDLLPDAIDRATKLSYPRKELLIVLHGQGFNKTKINSLLSKHKLNAKIFDRPENSIFGDNLNIALDAATGEYITKMDDDDYYGPNILQDLLAAYEYSRATFVGKRTNVTYLTESDKVITFSGRNEEKFVPHLPGHSFLTRTEILRSLRFGRVKKAIDSELWRRLEVRGGTMYSTHCLNFVRVRHSDGHTYEIADEDLIANSTTKPIKGLKVDKYFV